MHLRITHDSITNLKVHDTKLYNFEALTTQRLNIYETRLLGPSGFFSGTSEIRRNVFGDDSSFDYRRPQDFFYLTQIFCIFSVRLVYLTRKYSRTSQPKLQTKLLIKIPKMFYEKKKNCSDELAKIEKKGDGSTVVNGATEILVDLTSGGLYFYSKTTSVHVYLSIV